MKKTPSDITVSQYGDRIDDLQHPCGGRTAVYLVRHGQTEGNAQHLFIGSTDVPLDAVGERQAVLLGERLAEVQVDALITSPLARARQTAESIAGHIQCSLEVNPDLAEIDFGDVEGQPVREFERQYPELAALHANPDSEGVAWPNGESRAAFNARVRSAFLDVLRRHSNHTVVIVSHGGVIGSILALIRGGRANDWARFAVHNCSITHLEVDVSGTWIHLNNDSSHLDVVQVDLFALSATVTEHGAVDGQEGAQQR